MELAPYLYKEHGYTADEFLEYIKIFKYTFFYFKYHLFLNINNTIRSFVKKTLDKKMEARFLDFLKKFEGLGRDLYPCQLRDFGAPQGAFEFLLKQYVNRFVQHRRSPPGASRLAFQTIATLFFVFSQMLLHQKRNREIPEARWKI